ncbi:sensor histidine kinase [Winogradskyella endarachnes]|uniref:histidine kinase n=1 Tax=Winogradskyella endarachnes TaxID=2681965 RepID=A0A6L6U630_9FLAO|nr:sensor histidine kinase [Winogradskyella endarachnes]MUU76946.1 histidine kinase [Winogradskyella endarachnes]
MLYVRLSLYVAVLQKTISSEEIALISYVIFTTLTLAITFVLFFVIFQKRKNQLLIDSVKQQKEFDNELIKTQQEIQEETLRQVGRELHDNVGQMLVLSSMQMKVASNAVKDDVKSKVDNAADALNNALEEVRALSKSLNSDVISSLGFDAAVNNEVARLNKSGLIQASLEIVGDKVDFENTKDEIILFRILQEFVSNTLKYADAEQVSVKLEYQEKELIIKLKDDGTGFNIETATKSSGLVNMKKRAELLNADFQLVSSKDNGTRLTLKYPYKTD